jgi:COP9 signalosome complex subunit 1
MSLPDGHAGAPTNDTTRTRTAFDLDTYIGRYASGSETQIQRLVFIAHHCTSTDNNDSNSIKQSALTMLERLLKESGNTVRYQQVFGSSCEQQQWLMDTIKANEAALEVLEARLSAAQANLNKDAIRIAHLNLGDFFLAKGEITDALRHVVRARDFCTSRPQTLFICGKVIELAMNTCTCTQTNRQTNMMCFVSFLFV